MAGRTLLEGLKSRGKAESEKEKAFVFGEKTKPKPKAKPKKEPSPAKKQARGEAQPVPAAPPPPAVPQPQALADLVPLTTRMRRDYAQALKRASLERQLAGEMPNTMQDILEQALEPWLKDRGFLKD
jgi:hypothetical protein